MQTPISAAYVSRLQWADFRHVVRDWMLSHGLHAAPNPSSSTRAELAQWEVFRAEANRRGEQLTLFHGW